VEANPRAWAPLVSKWALDTLGEFFFINPGLLYLFWIPTKFMLDPILEFSQKRHTVPVMLSVVDCNRIRSDPKLLAASGNGYGKNPSESEQLRLQNEFEVKLLWKTDKI